MTYTNSSYDNPSPQRMALEASLKEADSIQGTLRDFTDNFELAFEAKHLAAQALKEAKRIYDDAEAEVTYEVMYSEEYTKGKNAEARKAVLDYRLIEARQEGKPLYAPWRAMLNAERELSNAELGYVQAEARFKAIRVAAELQASHLNAVSLS